MNDHLREHLNLCNDFKCPERIPTERFSSPNSPLPQEALDRLRKCIEEINSVLIQLTIPRDPDNLAPLRARLRMLRGLLVKVNYECDNKKNSITGLLKEAGRDFIEIEEIEQRHFIPFVRICSIERNDHNNKDDMHEEPMSHQELIDADPCLKREIILNFGNVVSKNPELINIFFGIPLFLELVKFLCTHITVETSNETIMGELLDSREDKICIKAGEEKKEINIADICKVTMSM